MTGKEEKIISETVVFVKRKLSGAEGGHDWWHVLRVWNNAKLIAKTEPANNFIVELGALLHDIADSKFYDGDETIGAKVAEDFLHKQKVDTEVIIQIKKY